MFRVWNRTLGRPYVLTLVAAAVLDGPKFANTKIRPGDRAILFVAGPKESALPADVRAGACFVISYVVAVELSSNFFSGDVLSGNLTLHKEILPTVPFTVSVSALAPNGSRPNGSKLVGTAVVR